MTKEEAVERLQPSFRAFLEAVEAVKADGFEVALRPDPENAEGWRWQLFVIPKESLL